MAVFGLGASLDASGGERRAWHRLTDAERAAFLEAGHIKVWQPGEVLALQGSPPTSVFVILRGTVRITATNRRGDHAPLATRGEGEIVGELGPISGLPRMATIEAIDEVRALVVTAERLAAVLQRLPHIYQQLLRTAAIRQQQSDRIRLESGGAEFPQRLAAVLLELVGQQSTLTLNVTQAELAGFARVSRSTLIRGLEELRKRGVVQTARHRVTIVHANQLRDLAAGVPPTEEG